MDHDQFGVEALISSHQIGMDRKEFLERIISPLLDSLFDPAVQHASALGANAMIFRVSLLIPNEQAGKQQASAVQSATTGAPGAIA